MDAVDDVLWWDTDGGDEEGGLLLDDDVDELVELALGVVVAVMILSGFARAARFVVLRY